MYCIFAMISKLCLWHPWLSTRHYDTLATGIIYFHRFYMFHSFKQFPRYVSSSLDVFLFLFKYLLDTWLQSICLKGDGCLLSVPGWQSGGDPKKVQRHHQDSPQPPEWRAVCTVWRRPQGAALACFFSSELPRVWDTADVWAPGMLVFYRKKWWCWRGSCCRPSSLTCRWSTPTCSCCAMSSSWKVMLDEWGFWRLWFFYFFFVFLNPEINVRIFSRRRWKE